MFILFWMLARKAAACSGGTLCVAGFWNRRNSRIFSSLRDAGKVINKTKMKERKSNEEKK